MWNRKPVASGLLVAAVAIAGACSDTPPVEPSVESSVTQLFGKLEDPQAAFQQTHDARLARVTETVPGYGGHFYDANLTLNVYMKGAAQARTVSALRTQLAPFGIDLDAQQVRVLAADYDFAELHAAHLRASAVLGIPTVVYTDVDDALNRVAIGVEDDATANAVRNALGMLDVPAEMVVIRRAERVEMMQSLRDRVRPVAGGLQINFPGFLCTLGANVRSPEAPNVHGFITNSHCSNNQWDGAAGNTPYWQPSGSTPGPSDPNWIGREVHDPQGFTGGICPPGRICRYSDAAGAMYGEGIDNAFARIYRTTGIGSLVIDQSNPFYNIVSEAPSNVAVGDSVFKVGRTTGFTRGVTSGSCVNTNLSPNFTYLCQDWVTGPSPIVGGGDSGSSTWSRAPAGQLQDVRINGLLCCSSGSATFIHSPMSGIRTDNPPPPGRTWRAHQ